MHLLVVLKLSRNVLGRFIDAVLIFLFLVLVPKSRISSQCSNECYL
jgi:hypothetical protein